MRTALSFRAFVGATVVAFLNAMLLSTAAMAAEGRSVACFVVPRDDGQAQAAAVMSTILRAEMAKLSGVVVRSGAPSGNPDAGAEAERLTEEGFRALDSSDRTGALTRFERAFDLLAQNPGVGSVRLHAKVAKGFGIAAFFGGNTTKATELIKRSLLLYPEQKPVEYAYSVDVKNVFDFAKQDINSRSPGNIEVRSTPDSAEVTLDGVFKGYTPITLSSVPAGSHLVEVSKDGYLRWSSTAIVPDGGRVATEAPLTAATNKSDFDRALAEVTRSLNPQKFGRAAEGLMKAVDAREALVVRAALSANGFEIDGFVRDLGGNTRPLQASIARDANFYKTIQDTLANALGAAVELKTAGSDSLGAPPREISDAVMKESADVGGEVVIDPMKDMFTDVGKKDTEVPITKTWWFWTIVGVGTAAVVGTITGIVLATSDDEAETGSVGDLSITLDGVGD